jgi:hypothetical protein
VFSSNNSHQIIFIRGTISMCKIFMRYLLFIKLFSFEEQSVCVKYLWDTVSSSNNLHQIIFIRGTISMCKIFMRYCVFIGITHIKLFSFEEQSVCIKYLWDTVYSSNNSHQIIFIRGTISMCKIFVRYWLFIKLFSFEEQSVCVKYLWDTVSSSE